MALLVCSTRFVLMLVVDRQIAMDPDSVLVGILEVPE